MNKLKMQTPDITDKNIEQIAKLFPNVMTEIKDEAGNSKKAIDFDLLKQNLSDVLVDDENERYRLDWPGKKSSLLKANTPISKTLRPVREESVNFDTTENLYIEGDNFEVLKILQESYLGKIKMIYIDPPYNTGKDFIYRDNFRVSKEEYEEEIGAVDEDGDKLFKNTDSNGRFHSDWLSMMYERLLVARDLLKDDGSIFISIDDGEVANIRKLCDEIFGEENFIEKFIWIKKSNPPNNVVIGSVHEYILAYSKNSALCELYLLHRNTDSDSKYKNLDDDYRGPWVAGDLSAAAKGGRSTPSLLYQIENPLTGQIYDPPAGRMWIVPVDRMKKNIEEQRIWWGLNGKGKPKYKRFLSEVRQGLSVSTLLNSFGNNGTASKELNALFGGKVVFETPKPTQLMGMLCSIATKGNDIVLDFFSGSAAIAHSTMQLNAKDNARRTFIMVQLPEKTDEKSEAYKAGYKTIAEIGKERIRRAGKQIMNDKLSIINEKQKKNSNELFSQPETENNSQLTIHNLQLDIGFRVYKTDTTNMKDVYYHPEELKQKTLPGFTSNIKENRTPDDLLTQVILDLGLELNLPIEQKEILGNTVFIVQTNALVACFDDNINFKIVDEIADLKPFKVVFKDTGFSDDKDRINVEERFKRLSPETVITVI